IWFGQFEDCTDGTELAGASPTDQVLASSRHRVGSPRIGAARVPLYVNWRNDRLNRNDARHFEPERQASSLEGVCNFHETWIWHGAPLVFAEVAEVTCEQCALVDVWIARGWAV